MKHILVMASWKTMINQLKIAINLLGRHADNNAKHPTPNRYASRTYENNTRSNKSLKE